MLQKSHSVSRLKIPNQHASNKQTQKSSAAVMSCEPYVSWCLEGCFYKFGEIRPFGCVALCTTTATFLLFDWSAVGSSSFVTDHSKR